MNRARAPSTGSAPAERSALGRYELLHEVGRGGMASVYVGRARGIAGFERIVAIKCCHDAIAQDADAVQMFLAEARLAAQIHHPNVVATLDVGHDERLYLVMDYVEGDRLSSLVTAAIHRGEKVPVPIALRVMVDALAGLHAAHELRDARGQRVEIVHRDVSPQNIMVGVDGIARIADFGIAKAAARAEITRAGQVRGKLGYISPERLATGEASRQCDVYAAGVVLWEALASRRLFVATGDWELAEQVLRGAVAPPSSHNPAVPPALDAIVMRAISRDRAHRYATAAELAAALEAIRPGPASGREVGEYVEAMLGPTLAARRAMIAGLIAASETASTDPRAAAPQPAIDAPTSVVTTTATVPVSRDATSDVSDDATTHVVPALSTAPVVTEPMPAPQAVARARRRGLGVPLGAGALVAAMALAVGWRAAHPTQPPATARAGHDGAATASSAQPAPDTTVAPGPARAVAETSQPGTVAAPAPTRAVAPATGDAMPSGGAPESATVTSSDAPARRSLQPDPPVAPSRSSRGSAPVRARPRPRPARNREFRPGVV